MYDKKLAIAILGKLEEAFPKKSELRDLRKALPDFSSMPEQEWLLTLDALLELGQIEGFPLRTGFNNALDGLANIAITPEGREFLEHVHLESNEAIGDSDDLLPIFSIGQLQIDFPLLSAGANRSGPLSLIFLDLDHFKSVNDSFGHPVGDEVLVKSAETLRAACDGKGRCYRWGGDEMAVLLQNYSLEEAAVLAERIRREISETVFAGYPHQITASIGVATYPETTATADALEKDADDASLRAKAAGRNQVCLASSLSGMSKATETRLSASEIAKRVETARVTAKIESGIAANFLLAVHNDSAEEIVVKEIQLLSRNDIPLTGVGRPPEENLWRIQPHATRPVAWLAQPDPAVQLANMNSQQGTLFETEIKAVLTVEILGRLKDCQCKMWVRVDSFRKKIIQLAG